MRAVLVVVSFTRISLWHVSDFVGNVRVGGGKDAVIRTLDGMSENE
jgi:hypothetical protein